MTQVDKVIEDFFLKHAYDPVYAREYYLRNRKLKGKQPKRIEEDEVPMKSPTGAKLVDFDGHGSGKATYSDGSSFDGNGWSSSKANAFEKKQVGSAQKQLNADLKKSKVKMNPKRRIDAAEQKLIRAKSLANRIKDPLVKADRLAQIAATQKKLGEAKKKHGPTAKPVLRRGVTSGV